MRIPFGSGSTSRLRLAAVFLPVVAVAAAAGCSTDRSTEESLAKNVAPIVGGTADTTNTWVVGIDVGGGGLCSGSLIAPNLVLTARHCVSRTPEAMDCRPGAGLETNKIIGNYPASAFRVSTNQDFRKGPSWQVAAVRYIDDPKANRVCGYDLALLELKKNASGFPTSWKAPAHVAPKKHGYVALGYGCQNPETLSGGGCDPRGFRMMLQPAHVVEITDDEFVVAGRVCGGDSGGPLWNNSAATDAILGALSRGDATTSEGPGCNFGVYTRTDAHWAWLVKYAKMAATNGGYAAPPWTALTPPEPDAGVPDTGPPPPPPKEPLGATCAAPDDCESGLCVDFGGGDTRCSETCSASDPCPSGFLCNSGYCQPEPPAPPPTDAGPVEEDAAPTNPAADDTVKATTCAYGQATPPPRPQPWLALVGVGLATALVRRRARDR